MVHICNGILLSHKKEQDNAICSNMDATRDPHTEWNKSEREIQVSYDITCMWNLKYCTNEPIYKTETLIDIQNSLVVAKGEGKGSKMDLEFGVDRCKLLHLEWISNEVLLYSTGDLYATSWDRTWCKIVWEKECIYIQCQDLSLIMWGLGGGVVFGKKPAQDLN